MRLLTVFLFAAFLTAHASGVSQTVSFSGRDVPLKQVFSAIKKQTGFLTFGSLDLLEGTRRVSLSVSDMPLLVFLQLALRDQPLDFRLGDKTIFLSEKPAPALVAPSAEQLPLVAPITGRVRSQDGSSLAGITFSRGNVAIGVSDGEGRFSLAVSEGDVIVVSAIGYLGLKFRVAAAAASSDQQLSDKSQPAWRAVFISSDRLDGSSFQVVSSDRPADSLSRLPTYNAKKNNEKNKTPQTNNPNVSSLDDVEVSVNTGYQDIPKERATGSFVQNTDNGLLITLVPNVSSLDDVEVSVNTGYQKLPKERVSGSFVFLNNKQLNSRTSTSVLELLDGKVNGLLFDRRGGSKFHIRGINSFTFLDPLIIVDNFPYYGSLNDLDPTDVENITVLKDAAAASIWGAKAGNGVIVISRKSPKPGQKPAIDFNSSILFVGPPDLDYNKNISVPELMDVERWLFDKGYYNASISNPNFKTTILSPQVMLLDSVRKNLVSEPYTKGLIDLWKQNDIKKDFEKYFYRTSVTQQYSLNLSGAGNKHSYLLNGAYMKGLGSQVNADNQRINLRALLNFQPIKNLEVSSEMSLISINSNSGVFYGYPIQGLWPYARLVDDNGNALAIPYTYNPNYIDTLGNGKFLDWRLRPYDELKHSKLENNSLHNNILLRVTYKPIKQLEFSLIYKHEKQKASSEFLRTENAYYTRNLINRFTQITGDNIKYIVPRGGILELSNTVVQGNDIRGQVSFENSWGPSHRLNLLGGAEISDLVSNTNEYSYYGYDSDVKTTRPVDYVNTYPISDGVSSLGMIPDGSSLLEVRNRRVAFFSNSSYSYKQRYIVTASARRDAANIYGVSINNKWKPLWSAGLAWIINKEEFFQNNSFDNLKLRVTYGRSGNAGNMSAKTKVYFNSSKSVYTNAPTGGISAPPNPDLKWEEVSMFNAGLDFSLWEKRLFGSFEIFRKKSADLISAFTTDPTTGFSNINRNIAEINGKGIDIQIGGDIIRQGLLWSMNGSFSFVKDVVSKFYGYKPVTADYLASALDPGGSITPMEGYEFYTVFSYRSAGLNPGNGNPRGYINNEISEDYASIFKVPVNELVYHGTALPRIHGFLNQNIAWKSFSLSVNITYKLDYYFRRRALNYGNLFARYDGHAEYNNRWQQPGDEMKTRVPSLVYPASSNRDAFYAWSDDNILKGDQIKLRDIRISHRQTIKKRNGNTAANVELFATMGNVGLLWTANKEGLDADYRGTPPSKNYSFGVRANF